MKKLKFLLYIEFIDVLKNLVFHIDFIVNLVLCNGEIAFINKFELKKIRKNIKILSKNIENLLVNFLSLATWFMDDGGKGGLYGIIISVHSFTNEEIHKLIYSLEKNFSISAKLHSAKSSRQLYIPKKHISNEVTFWVTSLPKGKFKKIISPFMIPTQRYKLL